MTATTIDTHAILARLACLFRDGGGDADHLRATGVQVTCGPDGRAVGFEAMAGAWQASLYLDPSGAADAIDRFPLPAPDGEILLLTCHADTFDHVARTVCEMWARAGGQALPVGRPRRRRLSGRAPAPRRDAGGAAGAITDGRAHQPDSERRPDGRRIAASDDVGDPAAAGAPRAAVTRPKLKR